MNKIGESQRIKNKYEYKFLRQQKIINNYSKEIDKLFNEMEIFKLSDLFNKFKKILSRYWKINIKKITNIHQSNYYVFVLNEYYNLYQKTDKAISDLFDRTAKL